MSTTLDTDTLSDRVMHEIREMILTGEILPGETLPTRKELAGRFGVSPSTVHEAVQALAAVGLVASRPGKGTWVRDDALTSVVHPKALETRLGELAPDLVLEARSVIEVALTQLAADRATPDDLDRIWTALERMQATIDDDPAFVEADLEFHIAVASAGHNVLLEQFYRLSRHLLSRMILELVRFPGEKEHSIRIQKKIAEAIEKRDRNSAREAVLEHMQRVKALLERFQEN